MVFDVAKSLSAGGPTVARRTIYDEQFHRIVRRWWVLRELLVTERQKDRFRVELRGCEAGSVDKVDLKVITRRATSGDGVLGVGIPQAFETYRFDCDAVRAGRYEEPNLVDSSG